MSVGLGFEPDRRARRSPPRHRECDAESKQTGKQDSSECVTAWQDFGEPNGRSRRGLMLEPGLGESQSGAGLLANSQPVSML